MVAFGDDTKMLGTDRPFLHTSVIIYLYGKGNQLIFENVEGKEVSSQVSSSHLLTFWSIFLQYRFWRLGEATSFL